MWFGEANMGSRIQPIWHRDLPRHLWSTYVADYPLLTSWRFADPRYGPFHPETERLLDIDFQQTVCDKVRELPSGCWVWKDPDHDKIGIAEDWEESPERLLFCWKRNYVPGNWLVIVRNCETQRCVRPEHQFFAGELRRFYRMVRTDSNGCMRWQGLKTEDGYGRYFADGREYRAHRYAWEYERTEPPPGTLICHDCDVPDCVNFEHLRRDDHKGNMRDMVAKGRQAKGSLHPRASLRPEQADFLLDQVLSDGVSPSELSRWAGISQGLMRRLLRCEHWLFREDDGDTRREVTVRGRVVHDGVDVRLESNGTRLVRAILDVAGDGRPPRRVLIFSWMHEENVAWTLNMLQSGDVAIRGVLLGPPKTERWPNWLTAYVAVRGFVM
jgi:hypothetical protein